LADLGPMRSYVVSPRQYVWFAFAALVALTVIVLTGAAVRLTGSGLGCPSWPRCYGKVYPPLNTHAVIEFSNRLLTGPVSIAAGLAWLAALRRRPYRRDLVWLAALLPLGVVGQAVLGGFTVKGALDYGWVMSHFALSMLILAAAVALLWRAMHEPGERTGSGDLTLVRSVWGLMILGGVTIVAGTAATAAGPHAGGSPGQRINRLDFDGRGTMDFVIHRHSELGLAFGLLAVGVWWLARRRGADAMLARTLTWLCVLIALQGIVGIDQYETHLPTELVWVHVGLACGCWLACLWATCAAGSPRRVRAALPEPQQASRTPVSV
jgi:cytochrome c oxidase assembly protein subunit 15